MEMEQKNSKKNKSHESYVHARSNVKIDSQKSNKNIITVRVLTC